MDNSATKRSVPKSFFALTLGASYGLLCAGQADALPGTPTIQNGGTPASNATFTSTATTMAITQLVPNLAIVWNNTPSGPGSTTGKAFDILGGETVTFFQPSTTAVAYNSVSCAGCSATVIAGTLQSRLTSNPLLQGGRVWLFDPNGIVIGQGAVINVGGFIASSLQGDISAWLLNPNNPLPLNDGGGATPTNGVVTNDGNITAKDGVNGYVALIGNNVAATHTGATGSIDVGFGSINLAAGRVATITALNTGGLNFALSGAAGDAINVNNGGGTSAVANSSALTGASVTLSANVANALFASAVNTSGVIRAVNLDNSGGTIKLVGTGSPVVASNTLDSSGATGTDPVGTVQIIGDSVSLGATTVNGALTVEATTGGIGQTGAIAAGAASFTADTANQNIALANAGNTFTGPVSLNTAGTGTATIEAATLNLGASNVGGALTATSLTGDITESGALTAATGSSFTSAGNINLGTQANTLHNPTFATGTGDNLAYRDTGAIAQPTVNLHGGNITLISDGGTITQTGPINAAAGTFTTSGAFAITLTDTGNTFSGPVALTTGTGTAAITAAALNFGASTVGGALTAISTTGDITESGVLSAGAGSSFTSGGNINLGTQANVLPIPTFAFGATGNLALREAGSIALPTITVPGSITLISDTGSITQTAAATITATAGSFTTSAANQTINIGNTGNTFTGQVAAHTAGTGKATIEAATLDFGTSTVGGTLTGTAETGGISESGVLTAASGSFTTVTANQNIDLSTQTNNFTGPVVLATTGTGTAAIKSNVLNFGASNVGGALTGTSVTGDITESGALIAGTGSVFTSAGNINLGTQANALPIPTFNFSGASGNLSLREVGAIAMPTITVPGSITLISDTGTITQTGGATIAATAGNFTTSAANQDITIGNAGNTFTGAVSLHTAGTGNATIEAATLNLGASAVGGVLTATTQTGDITESGVLTAATGSTFNSAGNINLGTQANVLPAPNFNFLGATGNLALREVGSVAMPAFIVPGSITLISDTGTITQTGAITATAGSFTTSTANQAINLTNAGNVFTGPVSFHTAGTGTAAIDAAALNLGASTVGGTLTAVSLTGDITESGILNAATGSLFTSAGNINLGTQANVLPAPTFDFTGGTGNLALREAGAIAMPGFTVPGSITLVSDTGTITQTGAIVATAGTFTTSTANEAITLTNAGNLFTGPVSLNTTGAGGSATVAAAALNLGTSNVGGALTAIAQTGAITESGVITAAGLADFSTLAANQNINLSTQTNNFTGGVQFGTSGTGNASVASQSLNFAATNVGGTLTGTATTGGIAESGAITAAGGTFTAQTAGQNINLASLSNVFTGAVSLNTSGAGTAAVKSNALNLGTSTVGGVLTGIAATGAVSESGVLTAGGGNFTAQTAGQNINLATQNNVFSGAVSLNTSGVGTAAVKSNALNLGASTVGGALTATSVTGDITESGILTAATGSAFTSAGNINLGTQANVLPAPTFTFTGATGNLSLREAGAIAMPGFTVPGSITLISDTGTITQTGAIVATAGTFTTSSAGEAITLTSAGNTFSGPVSVNTTGAAGSVTIAAAALNFGASNVGGALTAIAQTGGITESGVITAAGLADFSTLAANQNINLSTQTNNFTGAVQFGTSGTGTASVTSQALNFAATNVGGTLTGTATTGGIVESGAITAAGGTFTAQTAGQNINLSTQANTFTGPVSLNTGGAGAASISAASLNLGTSNVGGVLTASSTSAGGSLTESGVLTDASASNFTSASSIDLSTQNNALTGVIALNSAGNAAVKSSSVNFGASTVGGALTGTATTGGVSESGVITAVGGNFSALTANQGINLSTQTNNFTGAVSLNTLGTGTAAVTSKNLNLGTSSVGGALSATTTVGDITQSGILTDAAGSSFHSAANINLATSANALTGPVSLTAAGNAAIASTSLTLGASTVGGTLAATSTVGDITETGVLTAPTSSFTSAGNIDLSTQPNALGATSFAFTGTAGNLGLRELGAISMPAINVPGSITLISDTGAITQTGAIAATAGNFTTAGANAITLANAGNAFSGAVSLNTGTGNATIEAAALNLGTSTVGGTLAATTVTGGITQSGVLNAPSSVFTSAAGTDLSTQANVLPGAIFAFTGTSGNLAFQNTGDINLAATTVPGSITLVSDTGAITQTGAIVATAGNFTTSAANENITLATAGNTFSGPVSLNTTGTGAATISAASLNLGASTVGGVLTASSTSASGALTESGVLTDASGSSFTSASSINLSTQSNLLDGVVVLNSAGAAAIKSDSLNFGASTVGGTLTGVASTGGISESGILTSAGGSFSALTANQAINLASQTNNFTGAVSLNTLGTGAASIKSQALNLGATAVGGVLTATSTVGDITESGVVDPTSAVFTSAGNINLGTQANVLSNVTFVFTGATGNLSFRDAGGISLAALTVPGTITLISDTGGIAETGALSATSGTFTTSAANQSINLGTQTNTFSGAVSLNTSTGGNAAVKAGTLNLGASTVGGTLTATSTTGSITESGVLTATGGSTFTSAANIDLSTQTNVLGGTVTAAAVNGFVNVNATQFAAVDAVAKNDITINATTGDVDHLSALTFAGNITAAAKGNMTVDGADAGLASSAGNVTLTSGGTISQTFAYNPTAAGTGLKSNDIAIRGNTVTLNTPDLGSAGNFVGIIANNLTTSNSNPSNLYFAVLTPSGQKIAPANLKINGLSALPVTPGVFLAVGNSLPQTEFNIGSPAYLNFVKAFESAPTFDLSASEVQTSAESLASALNVAANSQQGTSSVNGILGSTPDANISLFNIVGVCLPADQRDDEEAAKHKDCVPAKTTDNRSPKLNPLSEALSSILVASRSVGSATGQGLR